MRLPLPRKLNWPNTWTLPRLLPLLAGGLLFLLCFLIGLYAAFPDDVLRDRVLSEVNRRLPPGHRLEAGSVSLGFPLRLQLQESRLLLPEPAFPELSIASLYLAPTWSTLVGSPGLAIDAESGLGHLGGTVLASGIADLHLYDGRFDQVVPEMETLRLQGHIVSVNLVGQLQVERDEPLRFEAVLDELKLVGADQLGLDQETLALGQINTRIDGTGRALQIEQLALSGGDLLAEGSGRLILQQPLAASRIDLKLQVSPAASAGSGLRTLLDLLGPAAAGGVHQVDLRGRLLALQMN